MRRLYEFKFNFTDYDYCVRCNNDYIGSITTRGASLGAGFGASGELYTTRRGLEKNLLEATIIFATIFVLSIVAGLILPN